MNAVCWEKIMLNGDGITSWRRFCHYVNFTRRAFFALMVASILAAAVWTITWLILDAFPRPSGDMAWVAFFGFLGGLGSFAKVAEVLWPEEVGKRPKKRIDTSKVRIEPKF